MFITDIEDSSFNYPVFFKVNNYWIHYLREFDLQINLPEADFKLTKIDSAHSGIDILIGYQNKGLVVKTNAVSKDNIVSQDNIKSIVYTVKAQCNEDEVKKMYINLIVDRNVTEQEVDSIKNILNIFPEIKMFRVYKNDAANYGKYDIDNGKFYNWSWYGRFEYIN